MYYLLYTVLIIFFCFFYVSIIFNPNEAADKCASTADSFRASGREEHSRVHEQDPDQDHGGRRTVSVGSVADSADHDFGNQAAAPAVGGNFIDAHFPRWLLDGLGVKFYFGGTSLLIVVGVAMDTVNQIEAQLIMRHYEGFTPRAGRSGRRSGNI